MNFRISTSIWLLLVISQSCHGHFWKSYRNRPVDENGDWVNRYFFEATITKCIETCELSVNTCLGVGYDATGNVCWIYDTSADERNSGYFAGGDHIDGFVSPGDLDENWLFLRLEATEPCEALDAGPPGLPGLPGVAGPPGPQGVQGEAGEPGLDCSLDISTLRGPTGETGMQGAQVEPGMQGIQGEPGEEALDVNELFVRSYFQPEITVLVLSHNYQADEIGDPQIAGEEWANRYYHIKTPVKLGSSVMYRFHLLGYSYGIGRPLDIIWVGYTYAGWTATKNLWNQSSEDLHNSIFSTSQYIATDTHLYLKFGPISRYFNSFELKYQGHLNAHLGLPPELGGDIPYEVKVSQDDIEY